MSQFVPDHIWNSHSSAKYQITTDGFRIVGEVDIYVSSDRRPTPIPAGATKESPKIEYRLYAVGRLLCFGIEHGSLGHAVDELKDSTLGPLLLFFAVRIVNPGIPFVPGEDEYQRAGLG